MFFLYHALRLLWSSLFRQRLILQQLRDEEEREVNVFSSGHTNRNIDSRASHLVPQLFILLHQQIELLL